MLAAVRRICTSGRAAAPLMRRRPARVAKAQAEAEFVLPAKSRRACQQHRRTHEAHGRQLLWSTCA